MRFWHWDRDKKILQARSQTWEDGTISIWITRFLDKQFSDDDIVAVFAHELGHRAYRHNPSRNKLRDEWQADLFAIKTLRRGGWDAKSYLATFQKLRYDDEGFSKMNEERLRRLKRLFVGKF